jgi:formate hydrogenlyase subunit 4
MGGEKAVTSGVRRKVRATSAIQHRRGANVVRQQGANT